VPDGIIIDHFTAYLPHFKGLMYFALEDALSDRHVDDAYSYSVRDEMHTVVVKWAEICPTLEACCLCRSPSSIEPGTDTA
jgi:hypothetical protein